MVDGWQGGAWLVRWVLWDLVWNVFIDIGNIYRDRVRRGTGALATTESMAVGDPFTGIAVVTEVTVAPYDTYDPRYGVFTGYAEILWDLGPFFTDHFAEPMFAGSEKW